MKEEKNEKIFVREVEVTIPQKLWNEISDFIEINNLQIDVNQFIIKTLIKAFNIEKYGIKPFDNKKINREEFKGDIEEIKTEEKISQSCKQNTKRQIKIIKHAKDSIESKD